MIEPSNCLFLFHQTPPIDYGGEPILLLIDKSKQLRSISIEDLSGLSTPLVTHSFCLLVDWFRQANIALPKLVLDMESATKLIIGKRKVEFPGEKPWDMSKLFSQQISRFPNGQEICSILATHLSVYNESHRDIPAWMSELAANMPSIWSQLNEKLIALGEGNRFFEIEVPVYNAMLSSQLHGIRIDAEKRDLFLDSIDKDFLAAHHQLAIVEKIDVERAQSDSSYLLRLLTPLIEDLGEGENVNSIIRARRYSDTRCSALYNLLKLKRNKSILLRTIGVADDWCYPTYDVMGTVTGRILSIDPHLQHLGKEYRRSIRARDGCELLYLDYSHFEPSILASVSKDPSIQFLCSQDDFYDTLKSELDCGNTSRKAIKGMFLSYSYGKDVSRLFEYLIDDKVGRAEAESVILQSFLPLFKGIEEWKRNVQNELHEHNRIASLIGNHRYRLHGGALDASEKRWAISQRIQGTGSVILKVLINSISDSFANVRILLPMHDALLLEVPADSQPLLVSELKDCFRSAFEGICGGFPPEVSEKDYYEN